MEFHKKKIPTIQIRMRAIFDEQFSCTNKALSCPTWYTLLLKATSIITKISSKMADFWIMSTFSVVCCCNFFDLVVVSLLAVCLCARTIGQKLLDSLADTWDFFFCDVLSMLQAIFYPVQVHKDATHIFSMENVVFSSVCVCVSPGKGAVGASVGSAPLQEHHRPQPEAGRGLVSTPSQSSSFHHTDAASTTGSPTRPLSFHPLSVMLPPPTPTPILTQAACTNIHDWCRESDNRWGRRSTEGTEGVFFFSLQRDLTGSNLSVNTQRSNLPMTTRCPLPPRLRLSVWIIHVCAVR